MHNIHSRLPDTGTSIFAVMSRMALEHGAINLSQGFPDFRIDEKLIQLVQKYMLEGHNQYAPMPGLLSLRETIAAVLSKTYHHKADPESEITITAGATEGIYSAIAAFVGPGDEVILFDPSYDSYNPSIRLSGGTPIHINLKFPSYTIDWQEVEKKITSRTRMIIVNTPHNPTGVTLTDDDLKNLDRISAHYGLIVLSDEVYERLVFDDVAHKSVLSHPSLAERSIAVFSFGKTFHATGWKCGYAVAPLHLTNEIRKAHQFIVFSVNTPVQFALAEYMKDATHFENLGKFYQAKRDLFLKKISGSSLEPLACHGSYFQILSYRNVAKLGDVQMAEELTKRHKVASIPISVFYKDKTDNQLLRFCFAKKDETLESACEILRKI